MASSGSTAMASSNPKLKLLVDMAQGKVILAEAGKDAVDFLFSILTLPLCEVVRLVSQPSMVGCLGKLYGSVENTKIHLLTPRVVAVPAFAAAAALIWKKDESDDSDTTPEPIYYSCVCHDGWYSDDARALCPSCSCRMTNPMKYVVTPLPRYSGDAAAGEGSLVKGVVSYMVKDDLTVSPMSTISSITLLNSYGIKNVSSLEQRTVDLDMNNV